GWPGQVGVRRGGRQRRAGRETAGFSRRADGAAGVLCRLAATAATAAAQREHGDRNDNDKDNGAAANQRHSAATRKKLTHAVANTTRGTLRHLGPLPY